jgi:glycosyltransferase involved in cell wall biosynthesis
MISDTAEKHPNVVLHKHPDDAALAALLASAWAFCYPSTYEGFGIPYIEAMAAGTAIVTSRNSGAIEVLGGGDYGFICEDDSFGDRLIELLACSDTRCRFAAKGIARAKTFGAEAIAARYLEIYRAVARC